ncbi:MAG: hypothetical protein MZW92_51240 [Comamonadaceae bacterium]|nr:hypothetical protein [Comamonadaceae bacterium]
MKSAPITEAELHAYVDGHAARRTPRCVEDHLAAHPDEAARVAAYRAAERSSCTGCSTPALDEPVPAGSPRLAGAARAGTDARGRAARGRRRGRRARLGVARRAQRTRSPPACRSQAAIAHVVYMPRGPAPGGGRRAARRQHLVAWLSKRLGAPVRAPAAGRGRLRTGRWAAAAG